MKEEEEESRDPFYSQLFDHKLPYEMGAWEAFEEHRKKKENKRDKVIWYAAASLFLTIVVGIALLRQTDFDREGRIATTADSTTAPHDEEKTSVATPKHITSTPSKVHPTHPEHLADQLTSNRRTLFSNQSSGSKSSHIGPVAKTYITSDSGLNNTATDSSDSFGNKTEHQSYITKLDPIYKVLQEELLFEGDSLLKRMTQKVAGTVLPHDGANSVMADTSGQHAIPGEKEPYPGHFRRSSAPRWSAGVVSQVNASGSWPAGISPGISVAATLPLNTRLHLQTGINLGKQSLEEAFGGSATQPVNGMSQVTNVTYNWTGLDVPVKLRYAFTGERFRNLGVSLGVMSGFYFSQSANNKYRIDRTIIQTSTGANGQIEEIKRVETEIRNETDHTRFTRSFVPLSSLTVSLDLAKFIHGKQAMIIEPFFCYYPFASSGKELRYNTLGVQLRWSVKRHSKAE